MGSGLVRFEVLRAQPGSRSPGTAYGRHAHSKRYRYAGESYPRWRMDRISRRGPGVLPVLVHSHAAGGEYRFSLCFKRKLATKGAKSTIYLYGRKDYRQPHI